MRTAGRSLPGCGAISLRRARNARFRTISEDFRTSSGLPDPGLSRVTLGDDCFAGNRSEGKRRSHDWRFGSVVVGRVLVREDVGSEERLFGGGRRRPGGWGIGPGDTPLSIAGGLLGAKADSGGVGIYLLGVCLHFFIAFSAAAVYYGASRRLIFLKEHPLVCGLFYGAGVELV